MKRSPRLFPYDTFVIGALISAALIYSGLYCFLNSERLVEAFHLAAGQSDVTAANSNDFLVLKYGGAIVMCFGMLRLFFYSINAAVNAFRSWRVEIEKNKIAWIPALLESGIAYVFTTVVGICGVSVMCGAFGISMSF